MIAIQEEGTRLLRRLAKKFGVTLREYRQGVHHLKRGRGYTKSPYDPIKAKTRRKMAKKSRRRNRR